ncbi:gag-pol polyprotein [Cucumis melo var. makuwa]|uniref:Gag-pol polyprotein n=1 Tax=Cucumis melo var. makuwa TaxID=1194695 RepID=A0A5D3CAK8_CUCMM|nr:gag-pol polyprotein [Cucumis melo var. makuwa]
MPSMIIVDGVSVPKSEVDWIDVEEQASVGNARAFNTIFNDVDLNVFKLINSCSTAKEAWKILEVAYEGTTKVKISILQLVISKFEALKIENKKGKGIAFKSIYEEETLVNQYDNEANMNASIALLTKQFAKVVKKDGEERVFRCRECGEVGHYQTECPMFFRRKKKNFHATLSDEDTDDSEEEDNSMNAFTVRIIETNSRDESENSEENYDNKLTFEELKVM